MSSAWIEQATVVNQFFYRESPLPIGSPALKAFKLRELSYTYLILHVKIYLFFEAPLLDNTLLVEGEKFIFKIN